MRPSTAGRCGTGTGRALEIGAVRPVPRAAGLASFPDRWATQAATDAMTIINPASRRAPATRLFDVRLSNQMQHHPRVAAWALAAFAFAAPHAAAAEPAACALLPAARAAAAMAMALPVWLLKGRVAAQLQVWNKEAAPGDAAAALARQIAVQL
jgi:hypothetical protein